MTTYVVTRHEGALEWYRRQGLCDFTHIPHLPDASHIRAGDEVHGALPAWLAADICRRGGRYYNLVLGDVPPEERGRELTADDMTRLGARIERIWVDRGRPLIRPIGRAIARGSRHLGALITWLPRLYLSAAMRRPHAHGWFLLFLIVIAAGQMSAAFDQWLSHWKLSLALPAHANLRDFAGEFVRFSWTPETTAYFLVFVVCALVFAAASYGLYRLRHGLFGLEVRQSADKAKPRRMVVMNLSPLQRSNDSAAPDAHAACLAAVAAMTLDGACAPDAFRKVLPPGQNFFPWQQNFRVMRHHLAPLAQKLNAMPPRLFVAVVTREAHQDYLQFEQAFFALVRNTFGPDAAARIELRASPVVDAPTSLEAYRRVYRSVIGDAHARLFDPVDLSEISIDATSGLKLTSIAAAEATFGSALEFTYVESADGNRIHAFDVRLSGPPEFE